MTEIATVISCDVTTKLSHRGLVQHPMQLYDDEM